MDNLYLDIKRQLEPFKDRVFYYGLTEIEVTDIEQKIGKAFPIYFREFLKVFGVRQDFVFGLLRREIDFIEQTNYLPDEIKKSFNSLNDFFFTPDRFLKPVRCIYSLKLQNLII